MPDWNVELTYTTGQHQAVTKSVTIKDVDKRELAQLAGIEECLKWGTDEGTIPAASWEYWQECRHKPLMMYEVLTELETRWQLTVNIQQVMVPTVAAEVPPARLSPPAKRNGASAPPPAHREFKEMLADQLEFLQARQKELLTERKRLDAEYEENASSLTDIRNFLMVSTKGRKRKQEDERTDPS